MKNILFNNPGIRFEKENGESYSDWEFKPLSQLASIRTGNKDTQDRIKDGKYPFFVRSNTVERINTFSFDGEAVLTSGDGVGVGKNFHYIDGRFDFHQRVYCISNFIDELDGKFFYQYFLENFYRRVIRLSAKNSVDSVRMSMIADMSIPVPSIEEQQKIASFLTAVDDKINALRRKHELFTEYKRGVMQKIFTQEIRFKDENGEAYPDWVEKKLGEVSIINPKSKQLPKFFTYIDLESVTNGMLKNPKEIKLDQAPSRAQRLLQKNDILFQTVRPYQKNNYFFLLEGKYVASTGYAQIRYKHQPKFLYYVLHTQKFVNKVLARCTGTSYPAINSNDLSEIKIVIPTDVREQEKISEFLSNLDKKIFQITSQIQKMEIFKKGLLQQMFV